MRHIMLCPLHEEEACPPDCDVMREWRALRDAYARFWSDRGRGIVSRDKRQLQLDAARGGSVRPVRAAA